MSGDLIRVEKNGQRFVLGAFTLNPTGLVVRGHPSFEDWQHCGGILQRMEGAIQWWIGDWVNYGASRKDYGDKYTEALDASGYEYQTLRNWGYVAQNVHLSRRRDNLSFSVHSEVASLDAADQVEVLDLAEAGSWSVSKTRDEVRRRQHSRKLAALRSQPTAEYDIGCADPPWQYDNSGFHQSAAGQYPVMDIDGICQLPASDPTFPKFASESVLFLWATSPLLPLAPRVLEAWGFEYKACLVWVKDRAPNLGWWVRTRHELLLIGARGSMPPLVQVDSIIEAHVTDHSRKPAEAYAAIETMFPNDRRVEIFARAPRPGWDVWGHEV